MDLYGIPFRQRSFYLCPFLRKTYKACFQVQQRLFRNVNISPSGDSVESFFRYDCSRIPGVPIAVMYAKPVSYLIEHRSILGCKAASNKNWIVTVIFLSVYDTKWKRGSAFAHER